MVLQMSSNKEILNASGWTKMAYPEEVTQEQAAAIEEFKRRNIKDATPKMLEDETLFYRFMKARDFNLENAEIMFKKHLAWRKEYQIDTIIEDFKCPEVLQKHSPNNFMCFDKEDRIVRYIDMGGADVKGILNSCTRLEFIKYNLQIVEKDVELMKKRSAMLNKSITKIVYIYNYDKLTFANATYKAALEFLMFGINMYQDNYPERIKTMYIINASVYFTFVFSIIKNVIAAPVLEKIKVFGTGGWREEFLQIIDADELPAFLGGNRTDSNGDPLCRSFLIHGQPVPKHYLLKNSKKRLSRGPNVRKLKLSPFSKQEIKFQVDEPGSILEWEFETKTKDIGFGVYYKRNPFNDEKEVECIPKQRIDTCLESETGIYKCEKAGTYSIVFDNSYSWIYPKEIYYRAKILEPEEIEQQQ